jgi:molybdopterin converting factor small subunit
MAKIKVVVKYLGTFSQLTGKRQETVELDEGATIDVLALRLVQSYGRKLKKRLDDIETRPVLFLVADRPAEGDWQLADGDEVLLTYPAGGG